MENFSDPLIFAYSAGLFVKHLNSIEQEMGGVLKAEDIEYIHRMRVATRRLRASLSIFSGCFNKKKTESWKKEFRRVTLALGAARDSDVQIEKLHEYLRITLEKQDQPGINRLILRLSQKRDKLQKNVVRSVERLVKSRAIDEMRSVISGVKEPPPPGSFLMPLYELALTNISNRLDSLISYEEYIDKVECVAEMHEMRIAAKRLRYTMENFTSLYPDQLKISLQAVRQIQDYLGSMHDYDVWALFLDNFMVEERKRVFKYSGGYNSFNFLLPGIRHFREFCRLERQSIYEIFISDWRKCQNEGLWEILRMKIDQPVLLPKDPSAPLSTDTKDLR